MVAVPIKPMKLPSKPWVEGYVLDYHTISSTPTGDPYYRFDTKRTELGERLFQLKYRRGGPAMVSDIVDTVEKFVGEWQPPVEGVVPAPASLNRKSQPVIEVAAELARRLRLPFYEGAVKKAKPTPQMKNIDDWAERQTVLREAVQAGEAEVKGKVVLAV
jgi:hypothetical protein